jgi:hypothetical protein
MIGIMDSPRSRSACRVALVCVLAAAAACVFVFKASHRMPDFEVYWRAGARAAHAEPLYRVADGEYQFKYFPAFAMLAIPIGVLPLPAAKMVWFIASVGALVALLWLSVRALPERRKTAGLLVLVLIAGLGRYYAQELVLGQINLWFTLVIITTMLAFKRGREARGGFLVVLAIVVKPYALILVPWLAARRQKRSIVAALVGAGAACLLPAGVYGFTGAAALHLEWWRTVRDTTAGTLTHPDNISLAGMYTKWFGATPVAAWLAIATAALLLAAGTVAFVYRRGVARPDGLEIALLAAMTPVLSPQGWGYVAVVSTPAIGYLTNYEDRLPKPLRWLMFLAIAAIGLTLFDLLGRRLYYILVRNSITTLGILVVIASLLILRLKKTA